MIAHAVCSVQHILYSFFFFNVLGWSMFIQIKANEHIHIFYLLLHHLLTTKLLAMWALEILLQNIFIFELHAQSVVDSSI